MFEQLDRMEARFQELEQQLADPELLANRARYQEVTIARSSLESTVQLYRAYKKLATDAEDSRSMLESESDAEMKAYLEQELEQNRQKMSEMEAQLRLELLPKDPLDEKNTIVEIRAGAGGDEAALFAGDLYRMYSKFAEGRKWRSELISSSETGIGGFKEVIFSLEGQAVYSQLKYESGVHRVQRIPVTEASGRIHTSTVTVAVLPEAEAVDVVIDDRDLRIDIMRSSGPGGQSVNTTDSAVRIVHLPTNLVVTCQDEKSQHKNKAKAMRVLRARLLEAEREKIDGARADNRRAQVGTGDRSERIRTYNFPQGRLTDHRIGLTLYQLKEIMEGAIEPIVHALKVAEQETRLKGLDLK